MNKIAALLILPLLIALAKPVEVQIAQKSFYGTYKKLLRSIRSKKLKIFCIVDHAKNAKKIAQKLQPNKLILFGNPKMGTKLLQNDPLLGLYLPLRIAIYKKDNTTFITYDTSALAKRLDPKVLAKIEHLYESIVDETAR